MRAIALALIIFFQLSAAYSAPTLTNNLSNSLHPVKFVNTKKLLHRDMFATTTTTTATSTPAVTHTPPLQLDLRQVRIKARIVNIDQRYLRDIGIAFGTSSPNPAKDGLSSDLPQIHTGLGRAVIPLTTLRDGSLIDLQLTALEDQGHAKLIAKPELITLNKQAATLESGEEIPYQERAFGGNTSVAFKKAVLRLQVTPQIVNKKRVLLKIKVNQDKVGALQVNGVPAIRTQQLTTSAIVHSGTTIVLGGIFEQLKGDQRVGVPGLSRVPLIGWLFRQQHHVTDRKVLVIFVTPIVE